MGMAGGTGLERRWTHYGERGAAGDGEVEVPQVWTRSDDGAQDGAVVVPLLQPKRDREGRERGQRRKRCAHVQRGALAEDKGIRHAQGLERRARGEDLRLHERAAESADLSKCIGVQVGEDAWCRHARRMALEVKCLQVAVRIEEGAEWTAEGGVQLDVPVEHDVANQEGAQFRPAPADEAVCVYGGMWRVPVDGEVFEIGTALDEHIPESMIRYGFIICQRDCPTPDVSCLPTIMRDLNEISHREKCHHSASRTRF
jgi:hypothetical protein